MLQFEEYSTAWLIYFAAIIGLLVVTWRICRPIPWRYLRRVLLVTVAVLFLTPVLSESGYWAPAWIVASLELLFSGVEAVMPIVTIVVKVWGVTLVVYTILHLLFFRGKKEKAEKDPRSSRRTAQASNHLNSAKSPPRKNPTNRRVTPTIS